MPLTYEKKTKSGKVIKITRKSDKYKIYQREARSYVRTTKTGKKVVVDVKAREGIMKKPKNTSGIVTYQRKSKYGKIYTVTRHIKPKSVK